MTAPSAELTNRDRDQTPDLPQTEPRVRARIGPRFLLQKCMREVSSTFWDVMLNGIASSKLIPTAVRFLVYRAMGVPVQYSRISPGCHFGGRRISIGQKTFINNGCFLDTSGQITIGDWCGLGMEVMLITSHHDIGPPEWRIGPGEPRPITIGDGTWIAARATILPGVTIGPGCVIAAGALVTVDCEPNSLYMGVPAKLVRRL